MDSRLSTTRWGHDAGNIAIQAYFHDVTSALTDRGAAYRLGGDEVGLIVPACSREEATKIVGRACLLLQQESLQFDHKELPPLSIAAGLIVSASPATSTEQLRKGAEMSMYRAKKFTREQSPRPSSWSVVGEDTVQVVGSNPHPSSLTRRSSRFRQKRF
jgi:diguanylate cyclase (GGDEF)-like protein